ncbi:MAG: SDR family oxidoreductase [Flavobacteriia bacterium]|nr:SDR family oxidoreductase [Flavobacteriia bacterium]NBY41436.1 SDR family oxidoreductase [Flavobacteriia bacterium]
MKVLITGSNGLLGQKLVAFCTENHIDFLAVSKGPNRNPECPESLYTSLDLTDEVNVIDFFAKHTFSHCIHTAAMTNVDACEQHPVDCMEVNQHASNRLFDLSMQKEVFFLLLSTDFVFDGATGNYAEEDLPNPLSVYGNSKFLSEQHMLHSGNSNWAIARTIIVYGKGYALNKSNIFTWLLTELKSNKTVNLLTDQFRAPTWADDLAWGCMQILQLGETGIFHLCGPETLSIHEIGIRVAKHIGADVNLVQKSDTTTLNQAAKRPPHTGFDLSKSFKILKYTPKRIEETLDSLMELGQFS